ncbi:MAG: hypothetical protein CME15_00280 [Gemmatimonadetes bacterium]|jgi:hypothetical protein|nr:hypothetical protein [Gemmatimonadota bacterium]
MRSQALVVKAVKVTLSLALAMAFGGCSEPDNQVSRSTADGEFELVLTAERNWIVSEGKLPVRVVVRSLAGPLEDGLVDQVTFVVNNGDVSPRTVTAIISEAEGEYLEWVIFTAARNLSYDQQGEINAIFRDALATLKIRIVPGSDSL